MREKPFMLSSEGLCERPCIADVGGVEYLLPLANKDKVYDFKSIAESLDMQNVLIIGAGAGPRPHIGVNCEMMANVKLGENENINTRVAKITEGKCELKHLKQNTQFCILGNLFISEGKPGKVVKVIAKERKGTENFVSAMRKVLGEHYKDKTVGMGGLFVIQKGKAKLHVMPDYSEVPLNSNDDVNNWLKFFEMSAPLTCLSTFVSRDPVFIVMMYLTRRVWEWVCLAFIFSCAESSVLRSSSWSPRCPRVTGKIPRLIPNPEDCRSMFICHQGTPSQFFCPVHQVFDAQTQGCVNKKSCVRETDELPAFETCPPVNGRDVVMFPHPTDCTMYYVCDHGVAYPRQCNSNLHYNPEARVCDYPYRAKCKARVFVLEPPNN